MKTLFEIRRKIRILVKNDNLLEALDLLEKAASHYSEARPNPFLNDTLVVAGNFRRISNYNKNHLLSNEIIGKKYDEISYRILGLIDQMCSSSSTTV